MEIAEAIRDAGFRSIVASAGGRLVPELEALNCRHIALPLRSKSPWRIWRNARRLRRIIEDEGVRIVHARSRAPAWSAWFAARRAGVRFVTTYHGTYGEGWPGKRLYNSVMARGDRVIAISQHIAAHIRRIYGERAIRVILRGVDPRRFDPALVSLERVTALRSGWAIGQQPVVLLPARMTRWKGHAVLLKALPRLPGVTAVLAGDLKGREAYAAELQALAVHLGVADRVVFAGHVVDVPAAMLAADVVIHTSIEPEAFGRTVIEAQAMARPVIAANLGGPRETVQEGITGWLVPPDHPDELAAAISEVLALSPERRREIGEAARRQVPTMQAMQAATVAVYRELL